MTIFRCWKFYQGSTWDPDGRMILITFSESSSLGAIHFSSKPPLLDAHLLPVDLPDIKTLTNSIDKIAWDASGERLAVSYKDVNKIYKGLIAIYDVKRTPFISASLIGFIRGPGDNPQPITFSFHDKFKQGPLLSVCWSSGFCCTYPLLFRSHNLP
ncbi:aladin-like [Impatiens glandulifera]|uniref:aladin-like n=1 Tax=Impatiens glandulifera TaxID=253017 RepID=UPI001FB1595F|nr:aladin-like [Impatiens glandulifera]